MKKYLLLIICSVFVMFSCKTEPKVEKIVDEVVSEKIVDENIEYANAEFSIKGMTCAIGCAARIEKKLGATDGVKSAKVDFDRQLAMVEFDKNAMDLAKFEAIIKDAGESYSMNDYKLVNAQKKCSQECCADKEDKTKCENDCCKADDHHAMSGHDHSSHEGHDHHKAEGKKCDKDCKKPCCAKDAKAKKCNKDCKKSCCTKGADAKKCDKDCKKPCCAKDADAKKCEKDCKKACCAKKSDKA